MRIAIFDFDGTIYKKETFSLMMEHLKTHPTLNVYKKFYRSILPIYIAYKLKVYPETKMKEQMMERYLKALDGLTEAQLDVFFADAATKMKNDLNDKVLSRMDQHAKDGVYNMVVSGAFTPLLIAVTKTLPIQNVIGTEIPLHEGTLKSDLKIHHIQANRKNDAIHSALNDKQIDWANSFAYGDSYSDLSVLELVGNPIAVQPDDKLKAVAIERQWEIL